MTEIVFMKRDEQQDSGGRSRDRSRPTRLLLAEWQHFIAMAYSQKYAHAALELWAEVASLRQGVLLPAQRVEDSGIKHSAAEVLLAYCLGRNDMPSRRLVVGVGIGSARLLRLLAMAWDVRAINRLLCCDGLRASQWGHPCSARTDEER